MLVLPVPAPTVQHDGLRGVLLNPDKLYCAPLCAPSLGSVANGTWIPGWMEPLLLAVHLDLLYPSSPLLLALQPPTPVDALILLSQEPHPAVTALPAPLAPHYRRPPQTWRASQRKSHRYPQYPCVGRIPGHTRQVMLRSRRSGIHILGALSAPRK